LGVYTLDSQVNLGYPKQEKLILLDLIIYIPKTYSNMQGQAEFVADILDFAQNIPDQVYRYLMDECTKMHNSPHYKSEFMSGSWQNGDWDYTVVVDDRTIYTYVSAIDAMEASEEQVYSL
jgi:hypothetical protein